jgi:uncharacterized lipoprotein YbaY
MTTLFAQSADHPTMIAIKIEYVGLNALPWNSRVDVFITDISRMADGFTKVVLQKSMITHGEQIPIRLLLHIPDKTFSPSHQYSICGRILVLDRPAFECDSPILFRGNNPPKSAAVLLRRAR